MVDEYGAFGEMRIGKGNRSTRRKSAPVPHRAPRIPHDLTWDRTPASAVETATNSLSYGTAQATCNFVNILLLEMYTCIILLLKDTFYNQFLGDNQFFND
jgi:hypothetical protein